VCVMFESYLQNMLRGFILLLWSLCTNEPLVFCHNLF
jgi:hypothetical protein